MKVQEGEGEEEQEIELGKLNVVSYDKIAKKVFLVPVNGASVPDVRTELNRTYGQAVAEWDVSTDAPFNIEQEYIDDLDDGESGMLASFPQNMRQFNREFKRSRDIDNDAYYVFLVEGTGSDKKGFMPFKRQFGYIFKDNLGSTPLATAIAHELGHGAFRLKHPQSELGVVMNDNLMHNTNGTTLRKYQWDNIHDPENVSSWFQDDDESAMDICYWWESLKDEYSPDEIDEQIATKTLLFNHIREQYGTYFENSKTDNVEVEGHTAWTVRKFSHSRNNSGSFKLVESLFQKIIQENPPQLNVHDKGVFLGQYAVEGTTYDLSIFSEQATLNLQKVVVDNVCELVDNESVKVVVEDDYVLISFFVENQLKLTIQVGQGGEVVAKTWLKHLGILEEQASWRQQILNYWNGLWGGEPDEFEYNLVLKNDGMVYEDSSYMMISALPEMPPLSVEIESESSQDIEVKLRLKIDYRRDIRQDEDYFPNDGWHETGLNEEWEIDFGDRIRGGRATLYTQVGDDYMDTVVFFIRGTNPSENNVQDYIDEEEYDTWFFTRLIRQESNYIHFNDGTNYGPDWNDSQGCPNWGPPHGWGLCQLDLLSGGQRPTAQELWSWKANIDRGHNFLTGEKFNIADNPCRREHVARVQYNGKARSSLSLLSV